MHLQEMSETNGHRPLNSCHGVSKKSFCLEYSQVINKAAGTSTTAKFCKAEPIRILTLTPR
jgi:hypothetical protein